MITNNITGLVRLIAIMLISVLFMIPHDAFAERAHETEAHLISVLKSDADKAQKAITCKKLAVYGSKKAVPALAALLSDEQLASWARIGLEAIPDPACDQALRDAAGKLKGTLLVGVINSIGVRKDPAATGILISKLKDQDKEVVYAAAAALGRIKGDKASRELVKLLKHENRELRSIAAYSCVMIAEKYMKTNRDKEAVALYDTVRNADVPKNRIAEATRGAILARKTAGAAMIPALLESKEKHLFQVALRTIRELPRLEITGKLKATLKKLSPERQSITVLALILSKDPSVQPNIIKLAKGLSKEAQMAVVSGLSQIDSASYMDFILEQATGNDPELADAAITSMMSLPGDDVDKAITGLLKNASPSQVSVLLNAAAYRGITNCLPYVEALIDDKDPAVSLAALEALGELGRIEHVPVLVELMEKGNDTGLLKKALISIAAREQAVCVEHLLPLKESSSSSVRHDALAILAVAGGPAALGAVVSLVNDKNEEVANEAVRTLSTWPNNWPEDSSIEKPLLHLAETGKGLKVKVLAIRGYVEYITRTHNMAASEKIAKAESIMKLAPRDEEKSMIQQIIKKNAKKKKIFNGKNLKGWDGDPKLWSVENGAITGKTGKATKIKNNTFLIWQNEKVGNFELNMTFRLEGENNSGVQYRSKLLKEKGNWVVGGYQLDIHPKPEYMGMLYEEKGRGIVAKRGTKVVIKTDGKKVVSKLDVPVVPIKLSDWHTITIIARNNHLIQKIDGVVTVEVIDEQESKSSSTGIIALQLHKGKEMKVQFKDIYLKALK